MLLVFLHHQRAGGSANERYLASGPASIPIVRADEGHLVDVHPDFGAVRSRALDPACHRASFHGLIALDQAIRVGPDQRDAAWWRCSLRSSKTRSA